MLTGYKLLAKFHEPNSSGSLDILQDFHFFKILKSEPGPKSIKKNLTGKKKKKRGPRAMAHSPE